MTERERVPTRDPPQPVLTDMGPPTSNKGGPDVADNTEEELQPVLTDMRSPTSNGGGPDVADDTEEELQPVLIDMGPPTSNGVVQMPLTTLKENCTAWASTKQTLHATKVQRPSVETV